MTIRRTAKLVWRHALPLLCWATVMQLLMEGPWMPHSLNSYKSLCYLLIVFGGSVIATDGRRVVQYLTQKRAQAATDIDTILMVRGIGTIVLIGLEIATTLWDLHVGSRGEHFPLPWRVGLLTLSLPMFFYTSGLLLRRQDRSILERKVARRAH